ncbi:MAG: phosphoribosylglycinamide formyltransferase [Gammaproteobacteria bacterium]|nr:phosphoribosylglycinamide formyltransferase [Gammaproteobacteria bacterium]
MTRAVVLISGSGSNLQAFIDQVDQGELPIDLSLVVSNNPDAYGLTRAQQAGIDTACINHRDFDSREEFDQALLDRIDMAEPDIVILAGFMRILTAEFVHHFENRLVNIHPALLPKFPGTDTHQRAINAGEHWHGATIHFVVPEVDAGPIILQGRIQVRRGESAEQLQQRVHKIEHRLYPLAVKWFAEGRLTVRDDAVLLDNERSAMQLQSFDL